MHTTLDAAHKTFVVVSYASQSNLIVKDVDLRYLIAMQFKGNWFRSCFTIRTTADCIPLNCSTCNPVRNTQELCYFWRLPLFRLFLTISPSWIRFYNINCHCLYIFLRTFANKNNLEVIIIICQSWSMVFLLPLFDKASKTLWIMFLDSNFRSLHLFDHSQYPTAHPLCICIIISKCVAPSSQARFRLFKLVQSTDWRPV